MFPDTCSLKSPCYPGVTCTPFDDGSYECENCPPGMQGNGENCVDINEVSGVYIVHQSITRTQYFVIPFRLTRRQGERVYTWLVIFNGHSKPNRMLNQIMKDVCSPFGLFQSESPHRMVIRTVIWARFYTGFPPVATLFICPILGSVLSIADERLTVWWCADWDSNPRVARDGSHINRRL